MSGQVPGHPGGQGPDDVSADLDLSSGFGATVGGPGDGAAAGGLDDFAANLDLSVGLGSTGAGPGGAASDSVVRGLAPGTRIADRYGIVALLGQGGMGAVYRVRDELRKTEVALKVMLPSLLARAKAVARFEQEAEIMLQLSHQGIVRVYDVGEDRALGLRFFTMELMEGQSLREWIDEHKASGRAIDPDEALAITGQLLEALRYAHRLTVHRDLKPENVFLTPSPDGDSVAVKILDFGIAKLQSPSQFTKTSMAMGTA